MGGTNAPPTSHKVTVLDRCIDRDKVVKLQGFRNEGSDQSLLVLALKIVYEPNNTSLLQFLMTC